MTARPDLYVRTRAGHIVRVEAREAIPDDAEWLAYEHDDKWRRPDEFAERERVEGRRSEADR